MSIDMDCRTAIRAFIRTRDTLTIEKHNCGSHNVSEACNRLDDLEKELNDAIRDFDLKCSPYKE